MRYMSSGKPRGRVSATLLMRFSAYIMAHRRLYHDYCCKRGIAVGGRRNKAEYIARRH